MPKEPRTFALKKPRMKGDDVKSWQREIKRIFRKEFGLRCPIKEDGVYGPSTRAYSAALVKAMGLSVNVWMKDGVTPKLRTKLRNDDLTAAQRKNRNSKKIRDYRAKLRRQFAQAREPKIHRLVHKVIQDDWGYHGKLHDGVDVITPADAVIFAPVKCKVIDVRADGWWGKGAPSDPKQKAKGDGIIQLEILETVGPFKKGQHIGFGHAEKATVKVGQVVRAGAPVGRAGFANAWHIHLMLNDGRVGKQGIGNRDPQACLNYAQKHG